jgi:GTPase SAR1 family protein
VCRCTQIKTYSWDNAQVVLVGNKCDLEDERVVSADRGKQLADQLGTRIDYCNSLLSGCPKQLIEKLQKVQNSAARMVLRAKKCDHVTPLLHTLHWLPVQARIDYKLSVLCHNFFTEFCPSLSL